MKDYLICFDMDGTVLNEEKTINVETLKHLKDLSKNNKIVLCSGRPIRGIEEYYVSLELDTPIISDNGAVINFDYLNNHRVRIDDVIPIDRFLTFYNDVKEFNKSCFFSVGDNIYIYNYLEKLKSVYHISELTNVIIGDYTKELLKDSPYGLLIVVSTDKMDEFEKIIKDKYSDIIGFRPFGNDSKNAIYDIFHKKVNKGNAIKKLQKLYNIDIDHTICFGDNNNDISMFDVAKYKVAMKNGIDELKEKANYITKYDNDNEGIYHMLLELEEYTK